MPRKTAVGDLSARILAPLLRYVAHTRGEGAVSDLLAVSAPRASDATAWLTHAEFEAVLAAARAALDSDDEFRAACAHDLKRAYGPLLLLAWALSVERMYKLMARTVQVVSRVSTYEVADLGGERVWLRYSSRLQESRLMCLSRMAQLASTPTVHGFPPAVAEERQCIARGDPCCEYVLSWERRPRRRGR